MGIISYFPGAEPSAGTESGSARENAADDSPADRIRRGRLIIEGVGLADETAAPQTVAERKAERAAEAADARKARRAENVSIAALTRRGRCPT